MARMNNKEGVNTYVQCKFDHKFFKRSTRKSRKNDG